MRGIGACIGLNASFLNIVTEWLSDIKLGHCTTAFYLNENFCCWGAEDGGLCLAGFFFLEGSRGLIAFFFFCWEGLGCPEWKTWSTVWPVNYLLYILFSVGF